MKLLLFFFPLKKITRDYEIITFLFVCFLKRKKNGHAFTKLVLFCLFSCPLPHEDYFRVLALPKHRNRLIRNYVNTPA